MEERKIRLLVVDDSLFFRSMLVRGLSQYSDIDVVGEAYDPYNARDKILALEPDIMTLDIEMPNMNGVEFLKILLPQWKIPVIVVSSLKSAEDTVRRVGAVDFLHKPDAKNSESVTAFIAELARKVHAGVRKTPLTHAPVRSGRGSPLIALGASTGGTQATTKIIKALPEDTPGIVIVQHMPPDFTRMYADGLNRDSAMTVTEATDGEVVTRGKVLIAPGGNQHMELQRMPDGYCVRLRAGEKVSGHCPSVDALFHSVAKNAPGKSTVGVLLTGMGMDGARGLTAMRNTGSYTIGQDEATSVVYGMPKEAYDMGGVVKQAPLDQIAGLITSYVKGL